MNAPSSTVLVTGGSGFIGSSLVARLRSDGIMPLAPRSSELDIRNWPQVEAYFARERPGTVFHLASTARGRRDCDEFLDVYQSNTTGTVHILEACRRYDVPRLIVTGTGDETGAAAATDGLRRPDQIKEPRSAYAASKAAATLFCEAACRFSEQRPTVLRLFAVYGPGQSLDFLLPSLLAALKTGTPLSMTGGLQRRDFVWLNDVVEVLLAVANKDEARGRTIDVCTGRTYALRELVELLAELSGRPVPAEFGVEAYRPGEPFVIAGDPGPLNDLVGPLMKTSLADGLRELLRYNDLLT